MENGAIVLKTNIQALIGNLSKKIIVVLISTAFCLAGIRLKNYVADKYDITESIFKAELLGTISMIIVYIVLGILAILLLISLYKFFGLFYELKRVTNIDFVREKILIQSYEFPFDKQTEEKKFNKIVGVEISQKSIDRMFNSGTLYIEYLVQSKNDSKLRGFEVPYVLNPVAVKDKLLEV